MRFPERNRRKESWKLLNWLKSRSNMPWCLVGDFNDLLTQSEKHGRVRHPNYLIQGFWDAVHFGGLNDVPMHGY